MKRFFTFLLALAAITLCGADQPQRFRGAKPSPREKVMAAKRLPRPLGFAALVPDNWCQICPSYDISGNNQYGDCVSAEEGNHWRAWSLASGYPMIDVPGANVVAWARKHGHLNGAYLTEVMDDLKKDGMADKAGVTYRLKDYYSVDYTSQDEVKQALFTYRTLNIAIAADQVDNAHTSKNGWIQLNGKADRGIDHCVGLHGYGTLEWLCGQLKVAVPSGADKAQFCVVMYTWGSVGIVNWKSLQGMMTNSEAWARDPGAVPSTPFPTPTPPTPGGSWPVLSGQLFDDAGRPIQGTITLILTGKEGAGQFPYIIQRDASGKYSPTPKILGVR
jgi:hypothetical protein